MIVFMQDVRPDKVQWKSNPAVLKWYEQISFIIYEIINLYKQVHDIKNERRFKLWKLTKDKTMLDMTNAQISL